MIKAALKRYEKYKESGIEWLRDVPATWPIVRNKKIFQERTKRSTYGTETLLTVSHITGVTPRSEKNVNMFMAETMEGYKLCQKGDLIINTMWAWMGALGTCKDIGICSPSYNVYMPKVDVPYEHRYFDYLFRIPNFTVEMTRNSKGIVSSRLRLYAKDFFQIETVLPNLETQKAIANYLDAKTAQIDRKIDLLTKKAALYTRLKQSLINQTVTRGLNKNAPLKDSGIEWIGEIPAHWEIKRLKEINTIIMGQSPSSSDYTDEGIGYPFLQGNAEFGKLSPIPKVWCSDIKKAAIKDDILLSVRAPVGAVNLAADFYGIGRGLCAIRTKANCKFWFYFVTILKPYLNNIATGSTYLAVSVEDVRNTTSICPPSDEQKAIADYLDAKTAHIDRIVGIINSQIDKLKELRKTLINDVVTGQIKVVD